MRSEVVNMLTSLPDEEKRAAINILGSQLPPQDQSDATVNMFSSSDQIYRRSSIRKMSAALDGKEKLSLAEEITRSLPQKDQENLVRLLNPSRKINDFLWIVMIVAFVIVLLFATYQAIMDQDNGVALTIAISMSTFLMGLIVPNPGFNRN